MVGRDRSQIPVISTRRGSSPCPVLQSRRTVLSRKAPSVTEIYPGSEVDFDPERKTVSAIPVTQWLEEWNEIRWDPDHYQSEPPKQFYMFKLSANVLKRLSGVYRRSTQDDTPRADDLNSQRRHEAARSQEISQYVRYGFPWSDLSASKRMSGEFENLRKPGWLPTAIIVNILGDGDVRNGKTISSDDVIRIHDANNGLVALSMPSTISHDGVPPIEVIDGQHRLWAFDEEVGDGEYELPVVAFSGLDRSWQAYLFWTINIKPKRINSSLAFDLYPLLRSEDWLDRFYGHPIYRETRAQELVEILWSHAESPWRRRINMLGETGLQRRQVSQAAWVNSLTATFVRPWNASGGRVGGFFGAANRTDVPFLEWTRAQQGAYLIFFWQELKKAINLTESPWATSLRTFQDSSGNESSMRSHGEDQDNGSATALDSAWEGRYSLLVTDQGVRGALMAINDVSHIAFGELHEFAFRFDESTNQEDDDNVSVALQSLKGNPNVAEFVRTSASKLAEFDWRTSSFPNLSDDEKRKQAAYRGSGGYTMLRTDLLLLLSEEPGIIGRAAAVAKR